MSPRRPLAWRLRVWILPVLLLPLAACRDEAMKTPGNTEQPEEAAGSHDAEEPAGHEDHHGMEAAGGDQLTLDAEVLRDLKLTTFPAELRPGGEGVTVLGELAVDERAYAEVGTPISGRIVRLLAAPGQAVARGQALAELQSVELGQARAARSAARARAELARKTADRKRGLAAERIVSQGELERAEADLAAAEAERGAAEAAVAALGVQMRAGQKDISGFALLSPIAGTVLQRSGVLGQSAEPSRPLFRVADLSRLWLVVQAPERDASRVSPGSPAEIALAALPGEKVEAAVAWVGGEVDAHSRTVPVRIDLPNTGGRLKPGMFATAWIRTGRDEKKVVAVPAAALQRQEDRWVVFLPRGAGRFEARPVVRGRDLGDEVAIVSGLAPGERVVVEGAFVLKAEAEKAAGGGEHHHD